MQDQQSTVFFQLLLQLLKQPEAVTAKAAAQFGAQLAIQSSAGHQCTTPDDTLRQALQVLGIHPARIDVSSQGQLLQTGLFPFKLQKTVVQDQFKPAMSAFLCNLIQGFFWGNGIVAAPELKIQGSEARVVVVLNKHKVWLDVRQ